MRVAPNMGTLHGEGGWGGADEAGTVPSSPPRRALGGVALRQTQGRHDPPSSPEGQWAFAGVSGMGGGRDRAS